MRKETLNRFSGGWVPIKFTGKNDIFLGLDFVGALRVRFQGWEVFGSFEKRTPGAFSQKHILDGDFQPGN